MPLPLAGIKVVDLSPTEVGARVSQLLADFGADVLWIEPPGGAQLRGQAAFPYFGRGKRSIVADLQAPEAVSELLPIIDASDVVIETFRPGVAGRLGLGWEELSGRNPRLIYTSITGWGTSGPFADLPGYEALVMAKLGVMNEFRAMHPARRPAFQSVPWASYSASLVALQGVLAALIEREKSGLGQRVETDMARSFALLDTWNWFVRLITDRYPGAFSSASAFDDDGIPATHMMFMLLVPRTSDGRWLQFAQSANHLYVALMRALKLEWMFEDPQWKGIPVFEDKDRRQRLWEIMLEAAGQKTFDQWNAAFDEDPNVFAELFRSGPEVLDHPQLVADGQVVEVGGVRMPADLVRLSGSRPIVNRPPPALGSTAAANVQWKPSRPGPAPGGRAMPLDGVLILELAVQFAAPFGATLLTDLGARVIKVEPLAGDPVRNMVGFPEVTGVKVLQGKESITVDLKTPEGVEIVHRLAAKADVVLEGYRAGVADRMGIGYEALRSANPHLVYLHATGYGEGPPNGHRPAYAPSIAAAGGVALANVGDSVATEPDADLTAVENASRRMISGGTVGNANADGLSAMGVAAAMLLGILARERNGGDGQLLASSMLGIVSHALAGHTVANPAHPGPKKADPDLRGLGARYRMYDAAEGYVFLAAPQEKEWPCLAAALAHHVDLASDARFATEALRQQNDGALAEVLATVFLALDDRTWERRLTEAGVGCVVVTTDAIESVLWDKDFGAAKGWIAQVEHPTFGLHPRLAPGITFSRSPTQAKPAMLAGQANDAVLEQLGYSTEQIAGLRQRGVIG